MKPTTSLSLAATAAAALTLCTGALAQTAAFEPEPEPERESEAAGGPAAEGPPEHSISFNLAAASDYRYRGVSQSRLKPAVSAGADYAHASGFYAGTWLTSITWIKDAGGEAPMEWDVYGGYKGTAGPLGYDVGLLHYHYPRHRLGVSPNTTELYGALSWNVLTLKYSHSLTNLFGFAASKHSGYLDLTANFDLGGGWSVLPHVGRQWIRRHGVSSYTDYGLTVNKDFGMGLVASLGVVGTNADKALYTTPSGRFTGKAGVVVGLKYTF